MILINFKFFVGYENSCNFYIVSRIERFIFSPCKTNSYVNTDHPESTLFDHIESAQKNITTNLSICRP